jgi:poly-gamma-glutamate capsule biosynthesis protein CapA/YwtB (metallophosphatase superfamily)
MRLEHVTRDEAEWLRCTIEHISRQFGIGVQDTVDGMLTVRAS